MATSIWSEMFKAKPDPDIVPLFRSVWLSEYPTHNAFAGNAPISIGLAAMTSDATNQVLRHCRIGKITCKPS